MQRSAIVSSRSALRVAAWRAAVGTHPARAPHDERPPRRVAVIGGGFAGLAVSYHLLAAATRQGQPIQLRLYDAFGLGAGGSGAAAGLLHPFTPRGKLLWRGLEAFDAALELLQAAEAAAAAADAASDYGSGGAAAADDGIRRPFVWRTGMLRPVRSTKQAQDIARFLPADPAAAAATQAEAVADAAALAALVPGLEPELLLAAPEPAAAAAASGAAPAAQRKRQQQQGQAAAARGLMVAAGATLHPASYMRAVWLAVCQQAAAAAGDGSSATLCTRPVSSLHALQAEEGPFDAVVVAAGAAVDSIAEMAGQLPLDLCHGHSLDMQPPAAGSSGAASGSAHASGGSAGGGGGSAVPGPAGAGYPVGAPSLLGSPYIAAHGTDSLVVGATKRYGLTPAEAYAQLQQPIEHDAAAAAATADALLPPAAQLWPPLAGWRVAAVRAGVRALPLRGSDGSIPYAGRVELPPPDGRRPSSGGAGTSSDLEPEPAAAAPAAAPACWVIGGLGARGLVYHAWLGRLVAAAVLSGSEDALPRELLRWRSDD